jgi:hypothetical protein
VILSHGFGDGGGSNIGSKWLTLIDFLAEIWVFFQ